MSLASGIPSATWDQTLTSNIETLFLHRMGFIRVYLQNLGVKTMNLPACSPDLNPIEHMWDLLGHAVHSRATNTNTLADLQQILVNKRNAIP